MARITVEDCRNVLANPYKLVMLAAERAGALSRGAEPLVEPGRDHWTVVALREIAAARLDFDQLRGDLLSRRSRVRADDDGLTDAFEHWEALAASDAGEEQR